MKIKLLYVTIFCVLRIHVSAQNFFMCFTNDANPKLALTVGFDAKTEKAGFVKYKGQNETIPLYYISRSVPDKGIATYKTTYIEKYRGKETGTYIFTHSGNREYITYTRKKDNKIFNFTIDLDLSVDNGAYRKTPCY